MANSIDKLKLSITPYPGAPLPEVARQLANQHFGKSVVNPEETAEPKQAGGGVAGSSSDAVQEMDV